MCHGMGLDHSMIPVSFYGIRSMGLEHVMVWDWNTLRYGTESRVTATVCVMAWDWNLCHGMGLDNASQHGTGVTVWDWNLCHSKTRSRVTV